MNHPLLKLEGLGVRYGSVRALEGLDLEVQDGELVSHLRWTVYHKPLLKFLHFQYLRRICHW